MTTHISGQKRSKSAPKTQHVFAAVFTVTLLGACAPVAKAAVLLLSLAG